MNLAAVDVLVAVFFGIVDNAVGGVRHRGVTGKEEDDALDDFLRGAIILLLHNVHFCLVLVFHLFVLYW